MFRDTIEKLAASFTGFSLLKIPVMIGCFITSAGIIEFWGGAIHWDLVATGFFLSFLLIFLDHLLKIQAISKFNRLKKGNHAEVLTAPWHHPTLMHFADDGHFIERLLLIVGTAFAGAALAAVQLTGHKVFFNLLLFVTVAVLVFTWNNRQSALNHWTNDFSDAFFTVLFPSLFVLINHDFRNAGAYFIGFSIPVFFLYLAYSFVLAMAVVDKNVKPEFGIFPGCIRESKIMVHHFFIAFGFVSVILADLSGVHWRVIAPQLICVLPSSILIIRLERIMQGSRTNWKLDGVLSIANVLMLLYFQALPLWASSL